MKKLIVFLAAVFFVSTLSTVNAWAEDPKGDVLDRHAVWTKIIEDNTGKSSGSQEKADAKTSQDDQAKMNIKMDDRPWARVG